MAKLFSSFNATRALGEVGVIVLGVLIALGVDQWRERRQEDSLELQYLRNLTTDVQQDLARIDVLEGRTWNRVVGATRLLDELGEDSSMGENQPELGGRSLDELRAAVADMTLATAVSQAGRVFILDTSSPTFDELRSTGHLRLIRNAELKRSIAEYYRAVEGSHFVDGHQQLVVWTEYQGLLTDNGIAVFDTRTSEDVDLSTRLRRIPNIATMVRRVRSIFGVQATYTYPLRVQAAELLAAIDTEIATRW
jgi:hypothetical protein